MDISVAKIIAAVETDVYAAAVAGPPVEDVEHLSLCLQEGIDTVWDQYLEDVPPQMLAATLQTIAALCIRAIYDLKLKVQ